MYIIIILYIYKGQKVQIIVYYKYNEILDILRYFLVFIFNEIEQKLIELD